MLVYGVFFLHFLLGSNFGSTKFLTEVTYGPQGVGYYANCTVYSDDRLNCFTATGTGSNLLWRVVVKNQQSAPTDVKFSYSPPSIVSVLPRTGPTSGTLVTIIGSNFAIGDSITNIIVFFSFKSKVVVKATIVEAFYNGTYDVLKVMTPEGEGTGVSIVVSLRQSLTGSTIESAPVLWNYDPPRIDSIVTEMLPTNTIKVIS